MDTGDQIQVKVNDCDTPTQVKEKILDAYYKNQAYSTRPTASDYDLGKLDSALNLIFLVLYLSMQVFRLRRYGTKVVVNHTEWHPGLVGVPINDEDLTAQSVGGWKRLNTLEHYSIRDQSIMKLVSRHHQQTLRSDSMYIHTHT